MLDAGNFFVIPGSPAEVWTAEEYKLTHSQASLRAQYLVRPEDLVVAVVGSPFLYHGSWREHALVMRALARAHSRVGASSPNGGRRIQLLVFGNGNHSSSYGDALQVRISPFHAYAAVKAVEKLATSLPSLVWAL